MPAPATQAAAPPHAIDDNGDSLPRFLPRSRRCDRDFWSSSRGSRAVCAQIRRLAGRGWTFAVSAAGFSLRRALLQRMPSQSETLLLFVAGEEMSWDALLGYTPPRSPSTTRSKRQLTFLPRFFGRPKCPHHRSSDMASDATLARMRLPRKVMSAIGATAPPLALAPLFAAARALSGSPVTFTGSGSAIAGCCPSRCGDGEKPSGSLSLWSRHSPCQTYTSAAGRAARIAALMREGARSRLLLDVTTGRATFRLAGGGATTAFRDFRGGLI